LTPAEIAHTFDAMLAFGPQLAAANAGPPIIRQIADPAAIFAPGEQFRFTFRSHPSYNAFLAWLSNHWAGQHHIMTIIEPLHAQRTIIV